MNIIYIHGFQSGPKSIKAQQLQQYCAQDDELTVHVPDLNMPPEHALQVLQDLVLAHQDVALVGSSLGGFYATQLVARYALPAVLINPAMRPWQLFRDLFGQQQLPYQVNPAWTLDEAQLDYLEQIAVPNVQQADKVLVLLQQGDDVLDYREAERYYTSQQPRALVMTEAHGNHAMDDFAAKIPMILQFFSSSRL
ncbi:YqiA/YcfP family alpha/beta fold hydrolase [Acinetobacter sp. ANC 4173]|uniref:YqiA/YcfP family alpha/beta fold hydrolase n=1 Tax=Acinetobacter sp. ANC 4173 TaxID=2529837 RepID=UPI00103A35DE|nr:YqiA/YcfP family alpha/beta fold hydrolase [Acinetobacter sp. ANC 4173]TCB76631.1 alpha/beta fold hydrolase [Acinetobacter sp. ANC 4173]